MSYRRSYNNVVGITSRSSQQDVQWLMDFIRQTFRDVVSDVKFLPITNRNKLEWEMSVSGCSIGILYHTIHHGRLNITDIKDALYTEELDYLYSTLGKDKVLVVLDDLENCSDSEKRRILEAQPSLKTRSSQLLLFPEKGKTEEAFKKIEEFRKVFGYYTAARDLQPKTNNYTGITQTVKPGSQSFWNRGAEMFSNMRTRGKSSETSSGSGHDQHQKQTQPYRSPFTSRLRLSIFSRAAQSNYQWLVDWLKNTGRSIDVHGVYITNNYTDFSSEISKCSFAILYHTIKHGRLNITDVTDSLYDEELKDLSGRLGKKNVIVVLDDVRNTDVSEKRRILESQLSIDQLARDLFLFDETKNNPENLEHIKQIIWKKTKDSGLEICNDNNNQHVENPKKESSRQSPSTSGTSRNVTPLQQHHSTYRSSAYPDKSEGPEAKKPNLEHNFLKQTSCLEFSNSVAKMFVDFQAKGQQCFEAFREEICDKLQEMEQRLQDKDTLQDTSAYTTHDETETLKLKVKELQMRIQELERQLEKEKQEHEKIIKDILQDKETQGQRTF